MAVIYKPSGGGFKGFAGSLGAGMGSGFANVVQQNIQQEIERQRFINGLMNMGKAQTGRDTASAMAGEPIDLAADPTPRGFDQLLMQVQGGMDPKTAMTLRRMSTDEAQAEASIAASKASTAATISRTGREEEMHPTEMLIKELTAQEAQGKIDLQPYREALIKNQAEMAPQIAQANLEHLKASSQAALAQASNSNITAQAHMMQAQTAKKKLDELTAQRKTGEAMLQALGLLPGGASATGAPSAPGAPGAPAAGPAVGTPPPAAGLPFKPAGMAPGGGDPNAPLIEELAGQQASGAPGMPGAPAGGADTVQPAMRVPGAQLAQAAPTAAPPAGGLNLTLGEKAGIATNYMGLPAPIGSILAKSDQPDYDKVVVKSGPGGKFETTMLYNKNLRGDPQYKILSSNDLRSTNAPTEILTSQRGMISMHVALESLKAITEAAEKGHTKIELTSPIYGRINEMAAQYGFKPPLTQDGDLLLNYKNLIDNLKMFGQQTMKGPISEPDAKRFESTLVSLKNDPKLNQAALKGLSNTLDSAASSLMGYFKEGEFKPIDKFQELYVNRGLAGKNLKQLTEEQAASMTDTPFQRGEAEKGAGGGRKDAGEAAAGVTIGEGKDSMRVDRSVVEQLATKHKTTPEAVIKMMEDNWKNTTRR